MNVRSATFLIVVEAQALVHLVPFFDEFGELALLRLGLATSNFDEHIVVSELHRLHLESAKSASNALNLVIANIQSLEFRVKFEHIRWNDCPSTIGGIKGGQAWEISQNRFECFDWKRWVSRNVELLDILALLRRHSHDQFNQVLAGMHVSL